MKSKSRPAKPRGKPFTKDDPRINKNGRLCTEASTYKVNYHNAISKLMPPDELARMVVKAARAGRVWAIHMLHDDAVGLPVQPMDVNNKGGLTVKVVQVKDQNGNGNSNGNTR